MKQFKVFAIASIAGLFTITGCEKAPQAEIEKAKQAIAAVENEALLYALPKITAAQETLDVALAEIKAQDKKRIKNYSAAKAKLSEAVAAAEDAAATAAKNKEALKVDAIALLDQAKTAVAEAQKAVEGAKKKAADTAKAALADAQIALAAAENAIGRKDFAVVKTNASAALEIANKTTGALSQPKAAPKK